MNTPVTPWMDLAMRELGRYHHLAWFLYGCVEREHLLNVQALIDWWTGRAVARSVPRPA